MRSNGRSASVGVVDDPLLVLLALALPEADLRSTTLLDGVKAVAVSGLELDHVRAGPLEDEGVVAAAEGDKVVVAPDEALGVGAGASLEGDSAVGAGDEVPLLGDAPSRTRLIVALGDEDFVAVVGDAVAVLDVLNQRGGELLLLSVGLSSEVESGGGGEGGEEFHK